VKKFKEWDAAEYIETKDDVLATLDVAFREGNIEYLLKDLGDIARSKGMTHIAREMGVSREGLYRSIAPSGNPSFETVLKIITLLGYRLRIEKAECRE
jgi:probable addiction module antidote protein